LSHIRSSNFFLLIIIHIFNSDFFSLISLFIIWIVLQVKLIQCLGQFQVVFWTKGWKALAYEPHNEPILLIAELRVLSIQSQSVDDLWPSSWKCAWEGGRVYIQRLRLGTFLSIRFRQGSEASYEKKLQCLTSLTKSNTLINTSMKPMNLDMSSSQNISIRRWLEADCSQKWNGEL